MDLNIHPYYDDHESQYSKQYKQLLFNPGLGVQARELTQLQSLLNDKMGASFNTVYRNGGLVEGCDISFSQSKQTILSDAIFLNADNSINSVLTDLTELFEAGDNIQPEGSSLNDNVFVVESVIATKIVVTTASGTITDETMATDITLINDDLLAYISGGLVYHGGEVQLVLAQNISITKTGIEKFGLKQQESIVTYVTDPDLTDPASGYPNYDLPGADRLKQTWEFVKDDADMYEYYKTEDGVLIDASEKPDYSKILDTLALRTYDESGNYLVEGMELDVINSENADKVIYQVSSGKAYVKGYKIKFIAPQNTEIDTAKTFDSNVNEAHNYATGTLNYTLNEPYVKSVTYVTATVETAEMHITKGSSGGIDEFIDTNDGGATYTTVTSVEYVDDNSGGGSPYTLNTDYTWNSSGINWSPAGSEPGVGTTYYVVVQYTKIMEITVDYTVEENADDPTSSDIEFTGTGDLPVDGTTMNFSYDNYLGRTDLIEIDQYKNVVVTQGVPSHWTQDDIPTASEQNLQIGTVKLFPNEDETSALIYEYKFERLTMFDLFKMRKRVDDLEINQAELALEAEAADSELPTELRGILVDNFDSFTKCNTSSTEFKCALNLIDNELTMAVDYEDIDFDADNIVATDVTKLNHRENSQAFLDMISESVALEIATKTKVMNLNPFGFIPLPGTGAISPEIDSWVDTVIKNITKTSVVNVRTVTSVSRTAQWWASSRVTTSKRFLNSSVTNAEIIKEKVKARARQITVKLFGSNWVYGKQIQILFDGIAVVPTATGTSTIVDDMFVVEADGTFTGTFIIPSGTKTGKHTVTFRDIDALVESNVTFKSHGIKRLIKRRKTVVNRVETRRTITTPVARPFTAVTPDGGGGPGDGGDPLAQSFQFDEDKMFTSIDLYFKTKGSTKNAFLQVGYIENGYPSLNSVFHYQEIDPGDIIISTDGSIASNLKFTMPFFIPANTPFFITIGSSDKNYNVFVSEMGEYDLLTGERVIENPYLTGVLFQSSNNSTWSPLQTIDLSFKLYEGTFKTTGNLISENAIPTSDIAAIMVDLEDSQPPETSLAFYFSEDNGVNWTKILQGEFNWLNSLASNAKIKIELNGDGNVTPVVDLTSFNCTTMRFDADSDNYYITKTVDPVPVFNTIKVIYDVYLPGGAAMHTYGSIDGLVWFKLDLLTAVSTATVGTDLTEYIYETDISVFTEIEGVLTSGTPVEGETFTNGAEDFIYRDHNSTLFLISDITGSPLTASLAFTGGTSGAVITTAASTNEAAYTTAEKFIGKIHMTNASELNSPVIEKLKFIMKNV